MMYGKPLKGGGKSAKPGSKTKAVKDKKTVKPPVKPTKRGR